MEAARLVVCPSGCAFSSIQTAINASSNGDTIQVQSGTYHENVNVTKQLTLRGFGNPVVDAGRSGNAITLSADGIRLEGFNVTGGIYGIYLYSSSNNNITGNNAFNNNGYGIFLYYSSNNNTLIGNNAFNNNGGIFLDQSSRNMLSGNNVSNNYDIGIYLSSYSDNNTLIGNNVSSTIPTYWSEGHGVSLWGSNNTLIGNDVSNNPYGIFLSSSGKNTLKKNIMNENRYNFGLWESSDLVFDNKIDATNLVDGKPVYYLKGAKDIVYDFYTNTGTIYCISCVNVTIKNLDLKNNGFGIFFWNTTNSKIQNVSASNNWHGISLYYSNKNELIRNYVSSNCEGHAYEQDYGIFLSSSSNNTLSSNNVLNNCYGISLESSSDNNTLINNNANSNHGMNAGGIGLDYSSNNTLSGNNVSDNDHGIGLYYSNKNKLQNNNISNNLFIGINLGGNNSILTGNNISNNGYYYGSGIFLSSFNNNLIYNNIFNNTNNINFYESMINTWNITKQSGTNIVGAHYLGGNFWAYPNGTGFSQTCIDGNRDGFCDTNYSIDSGNVDYLPLTIPAGYGYIYGTVMNNSIGIAGAVITTNISNKTNTDASGKYSILVPAGT